MNEPAELRDWWASPLGTLLRQHERRVVAGALEDVFGPQLLQIGEWGKRGEFFQAARTQRQAVVSEHCVPLVTQNGCRPVDICSRPTELAIASDSIDAVFLPHTLEFESDPYTVLREVDRVLVGDGKLLVLGFNPLSAWGLRHRLARRGLPPGIERLLSERRLRDWLALLSFEVTDVQHYFFQLPRPLPASAYLLKAHRRVYTLTPIKPRWREKRNLVGGLEPTTRGMHNRLHEHTRS